MSNTFEKVREQLGHPSYEDTDILVYQGDCIEFMTQLPAASIPLTVTSPPYNIGKEYESVMSLDDYVLWTENWITNVHNITEDRGAFWLNLGYVSIETKAKAIPIPYLIWDRVAFFLVQEIVWHYGAGVAGRKFFSPRNEKFLWYVKDSENYTFNLDAIRDPNVKYPKQRKNGRLKCNPFGKNPTDVWQIPKVTSGRDRASKERTAHPAQFPIELVRRIILASSNPGEIVLDPFMGSGSTIEAAIREGRKAIGFEINNAYVDMAIERIRRTREAFRIANSQRNLFDLPVGE